jgi:hypothetical protein
VTTNKFNFLKDDFQEEQSEETIETATLKPKPSESKPPSTETATISNKKEPKKAEVKEDKTDKTGKRNNPDYKVVGVLMPKKLHKKAKVLLMDDDEERDFSDLMSELLEGWLAAQDG